MNLSSIPAAGTQVSVLTDFSSQPIAGVFNELNSDYFILTTAEGVRHVISLKHVLMSSFNLMQETQEVPSAPTGDYETASATEDDVENIGYIEVNVDTVATTPTLPGPKVVGKIDLESIVDRRKKPRPSLSDQMPEADNEQSSNPDWVKKPVRAKGILRRLGPAFGFIQGPDGNDLYFNRYEIIENACDAVSGTPVVYSISTNARGNVAKAIHAEMNVGEMLDLIQDLNDSGQRRHISLLIDQLYEAYPDDNDIANELRMLGFIK